MFSYTAYGLNICSDRPLPELQESAPAEEITGRNVLISGRSLSERSLDDAAADAFVSLDATSPVCRWSAPGETFLSWQGVGAYLVRHGREIFIDPSPEASEEIIRLFLLGPVLAALLHQRHLLVLHASGVSINGGLVIFLGNGGWGKSTTARALHERGHHFVADDVVAIFSDAAGKPRAYPGVFQFKLWPEAAAVTGDDPENLPRLRPEYEKRVRRVTPSLSLNESLPLRRIYVLGEGNQHQIVPIVGKEAIFELIAHTYTHNLLEGAGLSTHFQQCIRLLKTVPICRLERKPSLAALPEIAELIEEDMARPAFDDA